jgi:uncharacterized SAM-binding protein YcdF (DUF218 family)
MIVATVLAMTYRSVLVGFADCFRIDDPAPADALVLLLGNPDIRPARAAELYRQGMAPLILLPAAASRPDTRFETETDYQALIREGVPAQAIRALPGAAASTHDEAVHVRDYVRTHPVRRITLVTSSFHTARARWIFRKLLRGAKVEVCVAAAPTKRFSERDWYRSDEGRRAYLGEALKTLYYRLAY